MSILPKKIIDDLVNIFRFRPSYLYPLAIIPAVIAQQQLLFEASQHVATDFLPLTEYELPPFAITFNTSPPTQLMLYPQH